MKKILMMGAMSGLGKVVVDSLIEKNNFIYLTVRTNSQLRLVNSKYKSNKNILCLKVDILNSSDLKKISNLDVDVFISFVGIGVGGSISSIDIDLVKENFETNVFAYFKCVQIVLKNMINKKGKIILLSSIGANYPLPFLGIYSSTKATIDILGQSLRKELKLINKNIKVIIIKPGMYNTGFNRLMIDNKYDFKSTMKYFDDVLLEINKKESLLLKLIEKKRLSSITNKIINAIESDNSKDLYQAPITQVIFSKIYQLFK